MSKYTTEVRFICETEFGLSESKGYTNVDEIINNVHSKIFNFEYPIFDTNYKKTLETKILKHYYTREIGEETVGLWKLRLNAKLNEIMPYYNQLYESELLKIKPLVTHDLTTHHKGNDRNDFENGGNVTSEGWNTNDNYNLYSDTPQGSLDGVKSENYLSEATHNNGRNDNRNTTENNANGWTTNENEYWETVSGFSGSNASYLLREYRKTFLNIDMQIIKELDVLFMQLW